MAKEAFIEHNGTKYDVPEGATAKDTLESLKMAIPELANAQLEKKGNNWVAKTSFGKKG